MLWKKSRFGSFYPVKTTKLQFACVFMMHDSEGKLFWARFSIKNFTTCQILKWIFCSLSDWKKIYNASDSDSRFLNRVTFWMKNFSWEKLRFWKKRCNEKNHVFDLLHPVKTTKLQYVCIFRMHDSEGRLLWNRYWLKSFTCQILNSKFRKSSDSESSFLRIVRF